MKLTNPLRHPAVALRNGRSPIETAPGVVMPRRAGGRDRGAQVSGRHREARNTAANHADLTFGNGLDASRWTTGSYPPGKSGPAGI